MELKSKNIIEMLLFIPPNENAQCFGIFKSKRGANLCSHMAQ